MARFFREKNDHGMSRRFLQSLQESVLGIRVHAVRLSDDGYLERSRKGGVRELSIHLARRHNRDFVFALRAFQPEKIRMGFVQDLAASGATGTSGPFLAKKTPNQGKGVSFLARPFGPR